MYCNNCGTQVKDNELFCPACGAAFQLNNSAVPMPKAPAAPVMTAENLSKAGLPQAGENVEQPPVVSEGYQEGNYGQDDFRQNNYQQANFQQNNFQQANFQQANFQQANYQQANYQQAPFQETKPQGYADYESASLSKGALVFGILGLSFACTVYLSILGIVFSAIGLGKAGAFAAREGSLYGKAKVGRGLALGGLIAGIVFAVLLLFIVIACTAAL